jgi:hypothetical protein
MKAILLLLGLVTLEQVQGVQLEKCTVCNPTHTDNKIRDALAPPEKDYYDIPDSEIWSQDVQLSAQDPEIATTWDKKNKHPGYPVWMDGFEGYEGLGNYKRVEPPNFQGPGSGDHQFMNSMITKYATELSTNEGKPTGQFVLKKGEAMSAAREVIETHMSLKGKEADDYLATHFDKAWDHFDSKPDGWLDIARGAQFMRFLTGNNMIDLTLQLGTENLMGKKSEFKKL